MRDRSPARSRSRCRRRIALPPATGAAALAFHDSSKPPGARAYTLRLASSTMPCLKTHLDGELQLPRQPVLRRDRPQRGAGGVGVRVLQVRTVGHVVRLHPKLKLASGAEA